MRIVTREQWGARPWTSEPATVPWAKRTEVLIHYHGGPPPVSRGAEVARDVDDIHHANGWSGVGYNWLVDQDGAVYEGRGWDLAGAHCPGHNTSGIGVYVAVGGDQKPTDAALAAARDLYDEACRRAGRALRQTWHGANYPTECPGPALIAWVKAGMSRPGNPPPPAPRTALGRVLRVTDPMMHGPDVRAVQARTGTAMDGVYGPRTESAVIRWQARHQLDPDGIVGPRTAASMGIRWTA